MKKYLGLWFSILLISFSALSQTIVSEKEFIEQVLANHPISKQADIALEIADNELLKAKGWFDPSLEVDYYKKSFDGKNYYQIANNAVRIPTWIGLDVSLDYQFHNGDFLNPENVLPTNGLWSVGVEVPLIQGLVFDKRRADVQKAKNYIDMSALERRQILNDLIFEATKAYWNWFLAYQQQKIVQEGVLLAENTFTAVKKSFLFGDKPAVDTLEALIQVQNRQIESIDATLAYQNAILWASSFLWADDQRPAKINDDIFPSEPIYLDEEIQSVLNQHREQEEDAIGLWNPYIQLYQYKMDNLEIEKRLKKEMLKPKLNVGYNFINRPFEDELLDQFSIQNYVWDVTFSMPFIFRRERGDVKLLNAQLQNAAYQFENMLIVQKNKIKTIVNKIIFLEEQLALSSKNVENQRALVNAEKRKFSIGESSLFLVNYREISFLKALEDKVKMQTDLKKTISEYYLEIGVVLN